MIGSKEGMGRGRWIWWGGYGVEMERERERWGSVGKGVVTVCPEVRWQGLVRWVFEDSPEQVPGDLQSSIFKRPQINLFV